MRSLLQHSNYYSTDRRIDMNINTSLVSLFLVLFIQLDLGPFSTAPVFVGGCFPYHRGKPETSSVKVEHIYPHPYASSESGVVVVDGNNNNHGNNFLGMKPANVSITVNLVLPTSQANHQHTPTPPRVNKEQPVRTSKENSNVSHPLVIDKATQLRLVKTIQNLLYGRKRR